MHTLLSRSQEKRLKDDKGFTLIELLVVVVIIGVLIAVAIPLYLNYQRGANDAAAQSDLRNSISVLELCQAENGEYPQEGFKLEGGGGAAGSCEQAIQLSEDTQLAYVTGDKGVTYTVTDTNTSGSDKVYCYSSATGGQVVDGASMGDKSCPQPQ